MNKKVICFIFILIFLSGLVLCEDSELDFFSFCVYPGIIVPMFDSSEYFTPGGGADLLGQFRLLPYLYLDAAFNYSIIPIKDNSGVFLNILSFGAGGTATFEVLEDFNIGVTGRCGYYLGYLNDENAPPASGNPFINLGLDMSYRILPVLYLGLNTSLRNFFGLYNDIALNLSLSYKFLPKTVTSGDNLPTNPTLLKNNGDDLDLSAVEFNIFPVLYKYYDTEPVGKALIKNKGNRTIHDLTISIYVEEYMNNPKTFDSIPKLRRNEKKEINLYALFNKNVLDITEGTKVSCNITCDYTKNDIKYNQEFIKTMELYNRNAITWDDDRKAAAFVTSKDPTILRFSKNIAGLMKGKASKAINNNLLSAIGILKALHLYGITYVRDPATPYDEFSKKEMVIDFLQFPNQTLQYKAGDCDDLSILYCAMLEAVGIETAFITIPGHIYVAFDLGIDSKKARKYFQHTNDFVFIGDKTWIPVEVTSLDSGFLKAWQTGAKLWRENETRDGTALFPMHDSWKYYTPVGYNTREEVIKLPNEKQFVKGYSEEVQKFINYEIYTKVAEYNASIKKNKTDLRNRNKLGTLYAKYGMYTEAIEQFTVILKTDEYVPALINMGNIHYLNKKYDKAMSFYERAQKKAPKNPIVLISIARIYHEMENYANSKKIYDTLKKVEPELAMEYSYLESRDDSSMRASAIGSPEELILWEEE